MKLALQLNKKILPTLKSAGSLKTILFASVLAVITMLVSIAVVVIVIMSIAANVAVAVAIAVIMAVSMVVTIMSIAANVAVAITIAVIMAVSMVVTIMTVTGYYFVAGEPISHNGSRSNRKHNKKYKQFGKRFHAKTSGVSILRM